MACILASVGKTKDPLWCASNRICQNCVAARNPCSLRDHIGIAAAFATHKTQYITRRAAPYDRDARCHRLHSYKYVSLSLYQRFDVTDTCSRPHGSQLVPGCLSSTATGSTRFSCFYTKSLHNLHSGSGSAARPHPSHSCTAPCCSTSNLF